MSDCLMSNRGLSSCHSIHYAVQVLMWLFSKWELISWRNNPLVLCCLFVFPGSFFRWFVISLVWFIAQLRKCLSDTALNVQPLDNLNGFIRIFKCLFLLSLLYLHLSTVSIRISLVCCSFPHSLGLCMRYLLVVLSHKANVLIMSSFANAHLYLADTQLAVSLQ